MEGSRIESATARDPETKLLQSIYRDLLKRSGIGFGVGFVLAEGIWSLLRRAGQQPSPWRRAVFTLGVSSIAAVSGGLSGSARYIDRLLNEQPDSHLAQQTRYVLRNMGYLKQHHNSNNNNSNTTNSTARDDAPRTETRE
jgi:hypothetical protein